MIISETKSPSAHLTYYPVERLSHRLEIEAFSKALLAAGATARCTPTPKNLEHKQRATTEVAMALSL